MRVYTNDAGEKYLRDESGIEIKVGEVEADGTVLFAASPADLSQQLRTPGGEVARAALSQSLIGRLPNGVSEVGDSITDADAGTAGETTAITGSGWVGKLILGSGGRLIQVRNWGVGGYRLDQMRATLLPLALADRSQIVTLMGGTNDIGQGRAESLYRADWTYMVDTLLANGKTVVPFTIPPQDGADANRLAEIDRYNAWIMAQAQARNLPVVDAHAALVDYTNGHYKSGYTSDGTHPSSLGTSAIADSARPVIEQLVATKSVVHLPKRDSDGATIWSSVFAADANADGVADGWTVNGGTTNITYSLVDRTGWVGKAQQVVFAPAAGATYLSRNVGAPGTSYAIGDWVRLVARVDAEVEGLGTTWYAAINFSGATNQRRFPSSPAAIDVDDGLIIGDAQVPSGTTAMSIYLSAALGTGTVRWGQVGLYNLIALGLA